jgi:hypothetical protein
MVIRYSYRLVLPIHRQPELRYGAVGDVHPQSRADFIKGGIPAGKLRIGNNRLVGHPVSKIVPSRFKGKKKILKNHFGQWNTGTVVISPSSPELLLMWIISSQICRFWYFCSIICSRISKNKRKRHAPKSENILPPGIGKDRHHVSPV